MHSRPKSRSMFGRLFRPLLAILVAFALLGMPVALQAAMPGSCQCMQQGSAAHQPCSEGSSAPCKGSGAACAAAMGCASIVSLPGQEISTAAWLAWSPVAYLSGNSMPLGHSPKPILGPPITI
jgi:hypothetical protein